MPAPEKMQQTKSSACSPAASRSARAKQARGDSKRTLLPSSHYKHPRKFLPTTTTSTHRKSVVCLFVFHVSHAQYHGIFTVTPTPPPPRTPTRQAHHERATEDREVDYTGSARLGRQRRQTVLGRLVYPAAPARITVGRTCFRRVPTWTGSTRWGAARSRTSNCWVEVAAGS